MCLKKLPSLVLSWLLSKWQVLAAQCNVSTNFFSTTIFSIQEFFIVQAWEKNKDKSRTKIRKNSPLNPKKNNWKPLVVMHNFKRNEWMNEWMNEVCIVFSTRTIIIDNQLMIKKHVYQYSNKVKQLNYTDYHW